MQNDLIQEIIRGAAKKYDELVFSLFEEYGYSKDEVIELMKLGVIQGTTCVLNASLTTEMTYFYVHSEPLFMVSKTLDDLTHTISVNYMKLKGESNESADN